MKMGDNSKENATYRTVRNCIYNCIEIIWRFRKSYILFTSAIIIMQGLLPAVLIVIMQKIINILQQNQNNFYDILRLIVIYFALTIFNEIISSLYSYYNSCFSMKFNQYICIEIMKKASDLQLKDFENTETYNIINRAQNQNGSSIMLYVSSIFDVFRQLIMIGSTASILLYYNWWILIMVLLIPVIKSILTIKINKKWYNIRFERTQKEREKWYINYLLMTGIAIKEIILLGISGYFIEKYKKISEELILQDKTMYKILVILYIVMDIIDNCISGFIYVFIIYSGFKRVILIGDVTAYTQAITNIKGSVSGVFQNIEDIAEQSLYIGLLFEFLALPTIEKKGKLKISNINCIEMRNVSFKYGNGTYVLKNINLQIQKRTPIAIVGENGSGKTTLIKLLLGFYSDYEGEILINGIELRSIDLEDYRDKISCVFQDYVKYELSIRENIILGDIKRKISSNQIEKVIRKVNLNSEIEHIGGIDVVIGNWFGKQELSIGQWQSLAISRALIKKSEVCVFDEPDSSLDVLRQNKLYKIFNEEMQDKIGIYISHKVDSMPKVVSYIYLLKEGEIVQEGTHDNLIKQTDGLYAHLFSQCI